MPQNVKMAPVQEHISMVLFPLSVYIQQCLGEAGIRVPSGIKNKMG
jgi:hypothetical protein